MQKPAPTGSLLVIFLTVFIDLLGFGMVLPLLPIYAEQFTVDNTGLTIGLLMASFSAMQFIFAPLWGRLSDRIGRRPVLLVGLAGSVVFYTMFGIATVQQSLLWLFIARIGAGIAGATIPTAQAYIADTTTLDKRARGMALIGAAFGLGFTFGPLFGYLAVPTGTGDPGPWPGYAAALLSLIALVLAWFRLPESLQMASGDSSRGAVVSPERRIFDRRAFLEALRTPSVGPLLLALFVCIFAFANFETTISMLAKGVERDGTTVDSPFRFDFQQVCLTFAYIGVTLTIAQGVLVRRLSGRLSEGTMATAGALIEMVGFGLMIRATNSGSVAELLIALGVVVLGFAFMMPSLNALVSRRSDPARQGSILGVAQSVSSLARILGPLVGIPLLKQNVELPYWTAIGLMLLGLLLVLYATSRGRDYPAAGQV